MGLSDFQRVSYRVFGPLVLRGMDLDEIREDLRKARMGIRAEAFVSLAVLTGVLWGVCALLGGGVVWWVVLPHVLPGLPSALGIFVLALSLIVGFVSYGLVLSSPKSKAKARAKSIDHHLPYALNYVAAMASAGVNVDVIFKSLSEQRIYGEVAREAEGIYRDIVLLGQDSITALRRAIERTPSDKFAEFLQGAITTVTSGGDLEGYFSSKAQHYMWENRQNQKTFVDMMGLMAETYVTAAVAGPLFLLVMMAIMGMVGGQGPSQLYLVVYILLPLANGGFLFALRNMTPEV